MRIHTCQNKCVKNIFSRKGTAFSQRSCLLTKEEALRSLLKKVCPCHRRPSPLDPGLERSVAESLRICAGQDWWSVPGLVPVPDALEHRTALHSTHMYFQPRIPSTAFYIHFIATLTARTMDTQRQ